MIKKERDYINEILFLIESQCAKIEKLNEASIGDETTDPSHALRMGRLLAYREVASQLQEALDYTNPRLYVEAAQSAGYYVWLEWEDTWMQVDKVAEAEYGRIILHGHLPDGKELETDCIATEPLRIGETITGSGVQ